MAIAACGDAGNAGTDTLSGVTGASGVTSPTSTSTASPTDPGTGTDSAGMTTDPAMPTASDSTDGVTSTMSPTTDPVDCQPGAEQCKRGTHQVCENGEYVDAPCAPGQFCSEMTESCQPCACEPGAQGDCIDGTNLGECAADCSGFEPKPCAGGQICLDGACVSLVCAPGSSECADENSTQKCNAEGSGFDPPIDCSEGQVCDAGFCVSACDKATAVKSNIGCEFWAVDMTNLPPRDTFVFAVAISNPSFTETANIQIFDRNNGGNEQMIVAGSVPPRQVQVFNLSGTSNGQVGFYPGDAGFLGNGIRKGRAFRVAADYPVVAVQFNPIGGAAGFTTDASLLLPTHVLALDYLHLAWNQGAGDGSTMVIAATEDNTTVTVTPKVNTPAGQNGLPAMPANQPTDVVLNRYDYMQVVVGPNNADLSGSAIKSSAPVAVFGGHSCAFVPAGVSACDHVEEQIFPLETWGQNYIASRNPKRSNEPMLWRILAAEDNTTVNFDPPTALGAQIVMSKGQIVEFQDQNDFSITADDPILVAGYMLGCTATGLASNPGDPYMLLMIPNEQFQSEYVFLVDSSYDQDFAKLVRPTGAQVDVACLGVVPENRWTNIGNSGYQWATIDMNPGEANCKPGTNEATGNMPFGISVSGQAEAASYAYPGGLALKPINPQ
ncbi:IgGFc-binding protein [Nannocystis sp. SCPEA4]|uniref:IgGFc-binding protein n=1 Tax=Nannocystis sp. SCPEA4 TaxID=2996787 RepID=UPI00226FFE96|nr:IgGFc-binding protein [Nannocystis sp. SCPEA4]